MAGELKGCVDFSKLEKEFGGDKAGRIYKAVSTAGGFGQQSSRPPLAILGASDEQKKAIGKILADARKGGK